MDHMSAETDGVRSREGFFPPPVVHGALGVALGEMLPSLIRLGKVVS